GLADLMADHAYGLFRVTSGEGWRPALRELGTSGWAAVRRHPWFARLAFSRPPLGPNALAAYEAALAELDPLRLPAATRMGFGDQGAGPRAGFRAGAAGGTGEALAARPAHRTGPRGGGRAVPAADRGRGRASALQRMGGRSAPARPDAADVRDGAGLAAGRP